MDAILSLFDSGDFTPRGACMQWRQSTLLLHAVSDSLVAGVCGLIAFALLFLAKRRADLNHRWMFRLFGAFMLVCGATRALAVWTLWRPDYGVEGTLKAVVSIGVMIALWRVAPKALVDSSKSQLAEAGQALERESAKRRELEEALRQLNATFGQRVQDQAAELDRAHRELRAETAERKRAEERFWLAIEASPASVVMTDGKGRIVLVNSQTERIFGYSRRGTAGAFDRDAAAGGVPRPPPGRARSFCSSTRNMVHGSCSLFARAAKGRRLVSGGT